MKRKKDFMFYEFFAGGGMARAGLGERWNCVFANDFDEKKAKAYKANWEFDHLRVKDVRDVSVSELPGEADLSWASFPCQDLSLAGYGAGLKAERSGTFWPFWNLMKELASECRNPKIIVLENVYGALTSHGGKDFSAIGGALSGEGYSFGAVVIDARHFIPQSRPRLFFIAVRSDLTIPKLILGNGPHPIWHPKALLNAGEMLPHRAASNWVWWDMPVPLNRKLGLIDLLEEEPAGITLHSEQETKYLLGLMSPLNREKVENAKALRRKIVGGVYRRTRNGVQRAEVRFDNIAGCLRTPSGGSSRQTLLIVEGDKVQSRLLSAREAARLMGLDDKYKIPLNYNSAYHLAGDGVVVPVVSYLSEKILLPILSFNRKKQERAA